MFDDKFVSDLPNDPVLAGVLLCDEFERFHQNLPKEQEQANYQEYINAASLFEVITELNGNKITQPGLTGNLDANISKIVEWFANNKVQFHHQRAERVGERYKSILKNKFPLSFYYEFTEGDLKRVQCLIGELRENIGASEELEPEHKQRLLKRLEKLQCELHKKVSDLDRMWGLVGEAGVVLGKLGENAKPIVDRIRELAEITWKTQARTEELPSDAPIPKLEAEEDQS